MTLSPNHATPSAHRVCPSLYAATRLARLVLRVKERLKSRMKSRRPPAEPAVICRHDSRNARVFEDAKYAIQTRSKKAAFNLPHGKSKQIRDEEVNLPTLLHELHDYTLPGGTSMLQAAEDDELFLKQDAQKIVKANNRIGLCDIFDVTTLLLNRLQQLQDGHWPMHGSRNEDGQRSWTGSICPKTVANLEHLLRCLQQASYVALISDMLRAIEPDLAYWHQHWQQSRAIFHSWFSEWPNGQRPLNTTWPWNVKPSLAVLWGVCWMFYGDDTGRTRKPPQWTQPQHPRTIETQPQLVAISPPLGNWINGPDVSPFVPWPEQFFTAQVPLVPNQGSIGGNFVSVPPPDIPLVNDPALKNPSSPSNEILWPETVDNNLLNPGSANLEHSINRPHRPNLQNPKTVFQAPGGARGGRPPYGPQKRSSNDDTETCLPPGAGLAPSPFSIRPAYPPSPYSDVPPSSVSPHRSNPRPPSYERSPSPAPGQSMVAPDVETSDKGVFRCLHKDCESEPPEFSRRCEYTKHRDKHDRPYICLEPGCEKIRGFTYAGGLLRHQREVHRQHGGPKSCYKCPHPNCKRSSGQGFSRKENLTEHLRRVHRKVGTDELDSIPPGPDLTLLRDVENPRKRIRSGSGGDNNNNNNNNVISEADSDDPVTVRDLQAQLKVLRKQQRDTDERVRLLENQVRRLSNGLRLAANTEG